MEVEVIYSPNPLISQDMLDYVVELLDQVGYHGSVKPVPLDRFLAPGLKFQLAINGWFADYLAASNFVARFSCGSLATPTGGFCSPEIDELTSRATRLQIVDPAAAGALWAEIDRELADHAPALWLVNAVAIELVSERVGNYQWSPLWFELLNQLWVR
jgi:peptide/nickel transport system substrate-binding protein